MQEDPFEYHRNKRTGKTYVSSRIPTSERRLRIASKVIDSADSHEFVLERGEHLIRVTNGGRQEIIAKFYEDDRSIFTLQIQRFNVRDGKPYRTHFSFHGDEVVQLIEFLLNMKRLHLPDEGRLNVTDEQLRDLLLSPEQARSFISKNQGLIIEAVRSEVTTSDIVAIGYRKKQLERYRELLNDPETNEAMWQAFFENNVWIFGYGLTYLFLSNLDQRKLEQAVSGNDLWQSGKRADAILKSRGAISALCFVEIKKHSTPLLRPHEYRPSCWAPSDELVGGVAQCQVTVEQVIRKAIDKLEPQSQSGDPTGEQIFTYQPRSFLIVGSLDELIRDKGVRKERYRSFELFRRNVTRPEIVTFDELYERAKFIVEVAES
jgi:Domain of unknown function (DUF4263)